MEHLPKFKSFLKNRATELVSLAVAVCAVAVLCVWLFAEGGADHAVYGVIAAVLSLALFALVLMLAVPKALRFFSGEEEQAPVDLLGERSKRRSKLHPWVRVFLTVLASRIILILIAYAVYTISHGYRGSVFSTLKAVWFKLDTDVVHYANIAENWYSTTFPDAWALVFLPLYPICIRVVNFITGNSFISAFVLNLLFSSLAGVVLYELALCDLGKRSARFAVFCAFALPAALFYTAPMSEPLFLLLACASLLAMRRGRFILAGVFGALAAFTRSLGIILLVPLAAEGAAHCVRLYKSAKADGDEACGRRLVSPIVKLCLAALILCCGTGGYLLINKLLWGDWFKFMQLQKENWGQSTGWFFNTACYQTEYMVQKLSTGDAKTAIGLWLPNLLYIFGTLAVFVAAARELRTSYILYFAAYFAVAIGATWLLSAPRYLTALAVLPIALAKLCEGRDDGRGLARARGKAAVVAAVLLLGQLIYVTLYVLRYKLY